MNARRRSTAEQVKHLNDRCSYPGARMVFAGTVCTKFMFARHTRQRIASTHAIWKTGSFRSAARRCWGATSGSPANAPADLNCRGRNFLEVLLIFFHFFSVKTLGFYF
jgi:hypothetical protein